MGRSVSGVLGRLGEVGSVFSNIGNESGGHKKMFVWLVVCVVKYFIGLMIMY